MVRRRFAPALLASLALLAAPGLLWAAIWMPWRWSWRLTSELRSAAPSALAAMGLLLVAVVGVFAGQARWQRTLPAVEAEEPLLPEPLLPTVRSAFPTIAVHGLAPGCGASTITFNLALLAATLGWGAGQEDRLPRPVCLLAEGALTNALGLSGDGLRRYVEEHPFTTTPDLVSLALRHPSGCELFCLPREGLDRDSLNRLVEALSDSYDAVLLDLPSGSNLKHNNPIAQWNATLLLVVTPEVPAERLHAWADEMWWLHHEERTVLVVNRVRADRRHAGRLDLGFVNVAEIPDEPGIQALDGEGRPWSIGARAASRQLAIVAHRLLGNLVHGGSVDGAA